VRVKDVASHLECDEAEKAAAAGRAGCCSIDVSCSALAKIPQSAHLRLPKLKYDVSQVAWVTSAENSLRPHWTLLLGSTDRDQDSRKTITTCSHVVEYYSFAISSRSQAQAQALDDFSYEYMHRGGSVESRTYLGFADEPL